MGDVCTRYCQSSCPSGAAAAPTHAYSTHCCCAPRVRPRCLRRVPRSLAFLGSAISRVPPVPCRDYPEPLGGGRGQGFAPRAHCCVSSWRAPRLTRTRVARAAILPLLARFRRRGRTDPRPAHAGEAVVQVAEGMPGLHVRVCGMLACRERLHLRVFWCAGF